MSSIWTPDGERPVNSDSQQDGVGSHEQVPPGYDTGTGPEMDPDQVEAQMEELRRQLAETPAALVVANHCFGLFELAALHLAQQPPNLAEAQLAIDALAALVENLTGRLGDNEPQLKEGLNQLRLAFVQIRRGTADGNPGAN